MHYRKKFTEIAILLVINTAIFVIIFLAYVVVTIEDPHAHMGIQRKIQSIYQNDPYTGYTIRPNLAADMPITPDTAYSLYTDIRGVRVTAAGEHGPANPQVVVIGDSQSFGMGVSNDQTYPYALSRELGVPVANLSVPGYSTVAALRRLENFGDFHPKIVILGHYYDHPRRNINTCSPAFAVFNCITVPYLAKTSDGTFDVREPRDNQFALRQVASYFDYVTGQGPAYSWWLDYFWWGLRRTRDIFETLRLVNFYPYKEPIDPGVAEVTTRMLFERLRNQAAAMGARPVVLYIPDYLGTEVVPAPAYLARTARDLEIPLVDATGDIRDIKEQDPDHLSVPNDGHLQGPPHRRIAHLLAERIRVLGLLN